MELQIGVLYNSTNYSEFNILDCNRDRNKHHILDLASKIRVKNLLHLSPMIVNGNKDVFDGQHRLGAAKLLGVAIYYLYDPDITHADIITLNTTSNSWKLPDYLKFYKVKGVPSYLKLEAFIKNNPRIAIDTALALMAPSNVKALVPNFKAGLVNTSRYEHAVSVGSIIKTIIQTDGIVKARLIYKPEFILSVSSTITAGTFNMEKLIRRLKQDMNLFLACETQNDLLHLLNLTFQI